MSVFIGKAEIFFHIPYSDYGGPPQYRQCMGNTVYIIKVIGINTEDTLTALGQLSISMVL